MLTKLELMEFLNDYEDDTVIRVEYNGCDCDLNDGDCFRIKEFEGYNNVVYLIVG